MADCDWCCCVAVDLRSRDETYQCGNDIRLSPSAAEVLDEGEGLGNLGHDGVEEPVVVGADIGHGLICEDLFQFSLSEICSRGHFVILRFVLVDIFQFWNF